MILEKVGINFYVRVNYNFLSCVTDKLIKFNNKVIKTINCIYSCYICFCDQK